MSTLKLWFERGVWRSWFKLFVSGGRWCTSLSVDMVTMSSEKTACRRKPAESNGSKGAGERGCSAGGKGKGLTLKNKKDEGGTTTDEKPNASPNATATCAEDSPNYLVYKKVSPL